MDYAHQYQIMSAKEWGKVRLSDVKKFNLDGPGCFQKYWHAKKFPEENYSTTYRRTGSLMILRVFPFSEKLDLQFVIGRQKADDYVKMLND